MKQKKRLMLWRSGISVPPSPPFPNEYSLEFDGVNEYLTTPAKVNLGVNSTISYWFKGGTNANNTLLGEDDNQYDYVIQLATGTNQVAFRVGTKYSTWVGVTELSDNNWHHYAFVRSSTSANLYVDGSLKSKTVDGTFDGTDTTFHVLGAQGNLAFPIDGIIDEFSGWNSALSSDDIATISSAPKDLKTALSSTPIVWWRNGDGTALFRNAEWDIPNEMTSDYFSQYSMEFDGVGDYVNCGNSFSFTDQMTVSAWIKVNSWANYDTFVSQFNASGSFLLNQNTATTPGSLYFAIYQSDGTWKQVVQSGAAPTSDWFHFVGVCDGSFVRMYVDGVSVGTPIAYDGTIRTSTDDLYIGGRANGTFYSDALIDEVAIWQGTGLSAAQVLTLYNSGTPTDLSSFEVTPLTWWRNGDSATWNGTNWLIPDATKSSLFSQKSFEFDGVNDSVGIGATSLGITGAISISAWVKTTATGAYRVIAAEDTTSGSNRNWLLTLDSSNKVAWYFWNTDGTLSSVVRTAANEITDGAWHHILATYDGTSDVNGIKLYVDGVVQNGTAGSTGIRSSATTEPAIGSLTAAANWFWSGSMDDVAIFDEAKAIGDIWDGSGAPTDLSGESGLVGYWIFDDATFSTNFTVPDNSTNSNNGTSANMDEVDLTLDTPTNLNSGVSANMDEEDKVLDSPGNEYGMTSVNMEEDSRTTDVPS